MPHGDMLVWAYILTVGPPVAAFAIWLKAMQIVRRRNK